MKVKVTKYINLINSIQWQIPDFLSDGDSNVSLSLTVCEIFAKIIKCQKFDLENEGQCQEVERDLRHSTGNIQIHIRYFF